MKIISVMITLPPSPESIIELTVSGCQTSCIANICKCLRNDLKCSEMYKCQSCENDESEDLINLRNYILGDNNDSV